MTDPARARPRPCASCPYRVDVPSGVWAAEEYAKLLDYDADTASQPVAVFGCHSNQGADICAGWLAAHGPDQLLAVRLGVAWERVDTSVLDYTTPVPVFGSGAEAAAHGLQDVEAPSPAAAAAIRKILTGWAARQRQAGSVGP